MRTVWYTESALINNAGIIVRNLYRTKEVSSIPEYWLIIGNDCYPIDGTLYFRIWDSDVEKTDINQSWID